MKPEELHAIASELGLQFDEESGSIYGVHQATYYCYMKQM